MCKAMASRVVQQVGRTSVDYMAKLAGMTEEVMGTLAGMRRLRTLRFVGRIGMRTLLRPGAWARIKAANKASNAVGRLGEEILLINSTAPKVNFRMGLYIPGATYGREPDLFLRFPGFKNPILGDVKYWEYLSNTAQLRDFGRIAARDGVGGKFHIFTPEYYTQLSTPLRELAVGAGNGGNFVFHSLENVIGIRVVAPVIAGAGVGHVAT